VSIADMPDVDATSERTYFGTVTLVVNTAYRKVLVMASPDYRAADWNTAMAEISYRCGYVPALGGPEWFPVEGLWVWEGDLKSISDLGF
jgi:hypothetical protein